MKYQTRINKCPLKTNYICGRAFIRELKSKITGIEPSFDSKAGFLEFSDGIENLLKKYENEYDLLKDKSDSKKLEARKNYCGDLLHISKSMYSSWWNGECLPSPKYRIAANVLFDGLADKWFSRRRFSNRVQLHLATLDLFELKELTGIHNAVKEAKNLLKIIHNMWEPVNLQYDGDNYDIKLWGPKDRGGYNPVKNELMKKFADKVKRDCTANENDKRSSINFDLSMKEESYVGLKIPDWLATKVYRLDNDLSILSFLYLLLNLELESKTDYMQDLVLDFLSALNCGFIIHYLESHNPPRINDKSEWFFLTSQTELFNYFYSKVEHVESEVDRISISDIITESELSDLYANNFFIASHHCFDLHYSLRDLFRRYYPKNKTFWKYIGLIGDKEDKEFFSGRVDLNYVNRCKLHTVKSHQKFRDLYYDSMRWVGLEEEELCLYLESLVSQISGGKLMKLGREVQNINKIPPKDRIF